MTLAQQMDSLSGLPYAEIFAKLKEETVDKILPIDGKDLRDVVTVLCSGLAYRLEQAPESALRTALLKAFSSMSINEFGFNLTDTAVVRLLDAGVAAGLIEVNERLWFYGIATKQVPKYPALTFRDVVAHFEPALVDVGSGLIIEGYSGNKLTLMLATSFPETTLVRIEASESIDGVNWTKFKRISHFYDVKESGFYVADLPSTSLQRKLRCVGELYHVTGTVAGV